MEGFLDPKTIYTIAHVLGAVIGAGAAFMGDAMYLFSSKDKVITHSELRFLKLSSVMVWIGLFITIISGLLLFSTNPIGYLTSSKFLVKMAIIMIIAINGVVFHFVHIPTFKKILGASMVKSELFKKRSKWVYASGGLSMVSWILAIALGSMRGIPYTFWEGFGLYLVFVVIGVVGALFHHKQFFAEEVAKEEDRRKDKNEE